MTCMEFGHLPSVIGTCNSVREVKPQHRGHAAWSGEIATVAVCPEERGKRSMQLFHRRRRGTAVSTNLLGQFRQRLPFSP